MSNPNSRKSCVVPKCKTTTINSPEKLFFIVPKDVTMRKKWIKAMKRLYAFGDKSSVYCCEDHFDVENDMDNYIKFKLVGGRLKLKKGTIPHKFVCQEKSVEKPEHSVVKNIKIEQEDITFINIMNTSAFCGVCLAGGNINLYSTNDYLMEIYEKLINTQVHSDDPRHIKAVCCFCYQKLVKYHNFSEMAQRNEKILSNLLQNGVFEVNPAIGELNDTHHLTFEPVQSVTINDVSSPFIKEEISKNIHYYMYDENNVETTTSNLDITETIKNEEIFAVPYQTLSNDSFVNEEINIEETKFIPEQTQNINSLVNGEAIKIEETIITKTESTGLHIDIEQKNEHYETGESNSTMQINSKAKLLMSKCYKCRKCPKRFYFKECLLKHIKKMHPDNNFKCVECNKQLQNHSQWEVHMRRHSGERPFNCLICNRGFIVKDNLMNHLRVHPPKPLKCSTCDETFNTYTASKRHKCFQTKEKNFTCSECNKAFYSKDYLVKHMKIHSGIKPFSCTMCDMRFLFPQRVRLHMNRVHGVQMLLCRICGWQYTDKSKLEEHLISHSNQQPCYICAECNDKFSNKTLLISHMMKHTGEKPFRCPKCSNRFPTSNALRLHIKSKKDPLTCTICEETFCQKKFLNNHMKTHGEEDYNYKCGECDKKFRQKHQYVMHLSIHTGEKPFTCPICKKCFRVKRFMNKHMITHSALPIGCSICEKRFRFKPELKEHMRIHVKERPFFCEICNNNFKEKRTLVKHMKSHLPAPEACAVCGEQFTIQSDLETHMKIHSKDYTCLECNTGFSSKRLLNEHSKSCGDPPVIHTANVPQIAQNTEDTLTCPDCKKQFDKKFLLVRHMKLHNKT